MAKTTAKRKATTEVRRTGLTKAQLERRTAKARLELEGLMTRLEADDAEAPTTAFVAGINKCLYALRDTLDVPYGLRVDQTAAHLRVSSPTIRKWLDEGLLEAVPGRRPVELTQESVIRVEGILDKVRDQFPARQWSRQLAAFLHDRDLQQQEWLRTGVEQGRRGKYVEL